MNAEPHTSTPEPAARWHFAKRIGFRFLFTYLLLYNLPFPVTVIPGGYFLAQPWFMLWNAFVPWVGRAVFGLKITILPNGSGDTTFNYVQVFTFAVLALLGTLIWSVLDRRRGDYEVLHRWLHAWVRFVLAMAMFGYGLAKVFMTQFVAPSPDRLLSTYGDSSPMGLLWTFMGASTGYCVFTGLAECISGLLLTMRRTTLAGALLCIAVMANVVMLNLCYDVPVKLYSSHLLGMAVFLVAPDVRRVVNVLVLNKAVPPAIVRPLFTFEPLHRTALVTRSATVAVVAALGIWQQAQVAKSFGPGAPRSPLHGIWNVVSFEADGRPVPPLITDATRWRRLAFSWPGAATVHRMNDQRTYYAVNLDEKTGRLTLTRGAQDKAKWKAEFAMARPQPDQLILDGTFDHKRLRIEFKRQPESASILISRGFHWVNEYPFNR